MNALYKYATGKTTQPKMSVYFIYFILQIQLRKKKNYLKSCLGLMDKIRNQPVIFNHGFKC